MRDKHVAQWVTQGLFTMQILCGELLHSLKLIESHGLVKSRFQGTDWNQDWRFLRKQNCLGVAYQHFSQGMYTV